MSHQNPLVRRYLEQLDAGLDETHIHEDERQEILNDIESHLAEAMRSGRALSDAITKLGPADDLAKSYCLELTLNPRHLADGSPGRRIVAALTRAGALLASTLLTIVMGSLSLGLLLGGFIAVLGGLIAPFLPSDWLDPTLRAGLPQLVVIVLGVILMAVGIPSFRLVHVILRFLIRTIRKDLRGVSK